MDEDRKDRQFNKFISPPLPKDATIVSQCGQYQMQSPGRVQRKPHQMVTPKMKGPLLKKLWKVPQPPRKSLMTRSMMKAMTWASMNQETPWKPILWKHSSLRITSCKANSERPTNKSSLIAKRVKAARPNNRRKVQKDQGVGQGRTNPTKKTSKVTVSSTLYID